MDDNDRFAWISDRCRISASQEECLINAPFVVPNCGVVGVSSEEDEDEMRDVETVVMVSVSESSEEGSVEEEEEEYRTPPERHSHSLTSSNEARIGAGEDEVDCVVQESLGKTVDLGRDCEVDGSEFRVQNFSVCEDGLVEKGECFPNTVLASVSVDLDNSDSETVNLGESITDGVDGCHVDANVTSNVEGSKYLAEENVFTEDDGEEPNAKIMRTFRNTEVESGTCSRDEGNSVNELKLKGRNAVNEVKRVRRTATDVCVSGHSSLEFRILPSSGDGGVGLRQRSGRPGTRGRNGSAGASEGDDEPRTSDAHRRTGTKASEPNEEELTNNLLKVLSFLAQPHKPVYKEKVDIIGAAIKAGITFPRPSWWAEVSDDDSE